VCDLGFCALLDRLKGSSPLRSWVLRPERGKGAVPGVCAAARGTRQGCSAGPGSCSSRWWRAGGPRPCRVLHHIWKQDSYALARSGHSRRAAPIFLLGCPLDGLPASHEIRERTGPRSATRPRVTRVTLRPLSPAQLSGSSGPERLRWAGEESNGPVAAALRFVHGLVGRPQQRVVVVFVGGNMDADADRHRDVADHGPHWFIEPGQDPLADRVRPFPVGDLLKEHDVLVPP